MLFVLDELGIPISDWIRQFFDQLRAVPAYAIVGGIALETLQTTFAALAWLTILRAAFPERADPVPPGPGLATRSRSRSTASCRPTSARW